MRAILIIYLMTDHHLDERWVVLINAQQ
jgi:hypothetical protein